jgi:hypothetical protein
MTVVRIAAEPEAAQPGDPSILKSPPRGPLCRGRRLAPAAMLAADAAASYHLLHVLARVPAFRRVPAAWLEPAPAFADQTS